MRTSTTNNGSKATGDRPVLAIPGTGISVIRIIGMLLLAILVSTASRALWAAPPNDVCAGALTIADGPYPVLSPITTNVLLATPDGDPVPSSGTCAAVTGVDHGVWYKWTPTVTGAYDIKVCSTQTATIGLNGVSADTVLATYTSLTGCGGTYTETACDDDACCGAACGGQSDVQSEYIGGVTYYIVVYHFTEETNDVATVQVLISQVSAPTNDKCDTATVLPLDVPIKGATNLLAKDDYEVPNGCYHNAQQIGNTNSQAAGLDVAYSFTAPDEGDYSFRVTGFNGGPDPIVYVAGQCEMANPQGPINLMSCTNAANRNTSNVNGAEESFCVHLTPGQTVYPIVDATAKVVNPPPDPNNPQVPKFDPITSFAIEANRCNVEVEFNGTPDVASALSCPSEGSTSNQGSTLDFDYFDLGSFPPGSRLFAMVDAQATNPTGNYDLRVTTHDDTVQFDDSQNTAPFGDLAPNIAGASLPGSPVYLSVSSAATNAKLEPYRLYAMVRPPGGGPLGTSAQPELSEPNDAAVMIGDYFYGRNDPNGSADDVDTYGVCAKPGDLIMSNVDPNPGREVSASYYRSQLTMIDPVNARLYRVSDSFIFPNYTTGAGNLQSRTPSGPGQAIVHRAVIGGLYKLVVQPTLASPPRPPDDYLWQASINCAPISTDLSIAISDTPDPVLAGGTMTYTITATNLGPNSAASPVLSDVTPPGTSFVSVSPPSGWTCTTPAAGATGTISCTPTGGCFDGTASFTLVLRAASCAAGPIVNTATLTTATPDAVAANNSASTSTAVTGGSSCDDANACTTDSCNGATNACDHTPVAIAESSGLRFTNATTLAWDSAGSGFTYDVPRGLVSQLPVGGGAGESCLASGVSTTTANDPQAPATGAGFWYLVRAKSSCGAGSYGATSGGSPRTTSACP